VRRPPQLVGIRPVGCWFEGVEVEHSFVAREWSAHGAADAEQRGERRGDFCRSRPGEDDGRLCHSKGEGLTLNMHIHTYIHTYIYITSG